MSDAWAQAPWLKKLGKPFHKGNKPLYLVGGAVRNPLMGLPLSDVDVCGPARPEEAVALCAGTAVRAKVRAAHFGTVELRVTDANGTGHMAEYTTFREDSYRCGHKPDAVRFATEIPVDALRRDFSVNALYRQVLPDGLGPVIDPTGGLSHLERGVLHTVTENPDQVLKDDGLRILRAVRFQAELDLRPTDALLQSLARHAALLRDIAPERLREELVKTLLADLRYPMLKRRAPAAETGLSTMEAIGAWPWVLGSLPYDREAVCALKRLPDPAEGETPLPLRMALLGREADPAALEQAMTRLCFSLRDVKQTLTLTRVLQALNGGALDAAEAVRAGLPALRGAVAALRALGREEVARQGELLAERLGGQNIPLRLSDLALRGDDMLALCKATNAAPARIGVVLNRLWDEVCRGALPNDRDSLLSAARALLLADNCDAAANHE